MSGQKINKSFITQCNLTHGDWWYIVQPFPSENTKTNFDITKPLRSINPHFAVPFSLGTGPKKIVGHCQVCSGFFLLFLLFLLTNPSDSPLSSAVRPVFPR
jgi:hypothetical protein